MGFLCSSLRGFSVLSHLAQSLLVSGDGSAKGRCPCSAQELELWLSQHSQGFAAGQM